MKYAVSPVKFLEDREYEGSHRFDTSACCIEDFRVVKDLGRGCMRTYLILKEMAEQWNADPEIQALLAEINADDGSI